MLTKAKFWAECQDPDIDFARCLRLASKGDREVPTIDAMVPIACYKPRSKQWSKDEDCIQRRGLRLSKSSDPNALRPLVEACYGNETGVGLQAGETRNTIMVAPFDASLRFRESSPNATSATAKASVRKWITKSRAKHPGVYSSPIKWSSLSVSTYEVELDGDGRVDQLLVATARTFGREQHEYSAALLATDKTTPLEFRVADSGMNHGTRIEAIMDLDSDGRFEVIEVQSDEGLLATLWTLAGSNMTARGTASCWP